MKKVIIIAMLLSLICVCGLSAGVCFADETSTTTSEWYYFEKSTATPNLALRETANEEGKVLLYIPHSYAFEKLEDPNGAFVKVKYNSKEGYIYTNAFNNNCKKVTTKWGNNPYSFDLSDLNITADKITTYKIEDMTADTHVFDKSEVTVNTVYGYRIKDNEYYFLVDATAVIYTTSVPIYGYIKASDTSKANFKEDSITESAGYILQTTVEKPTTPSGEINSGDNNPPSADVNGSDTQTPKNSLDRYILIAVIAVLCVVIVILIFVPSKKRQS